MQLRVARLCLDCEELHVGETCPVCASDRYAFLTSWLPVEERRRWRRQPPKRAVAPQNAFDRVRNLFSRLIGDAEPAPPTPLTRASDHLPPLDFGKPEPKAPVPPPAASEPVKSDVH
jgi:hypothetical protein